MRLAVLLAPLALGACVTVYPPDEPSEALAYARLGETVSVGAARVTPLALLEDSRCPQGVQCVWAGRVRITARISTGAGTTTRELTSGQPVTVADGALTLVEVQPLRRRDAPPRPEDYRFGFRFDGGL
ncbi:MAG: hypothetical protein LC648_07070 [Novosphingobium sp.]|nr:hypothetical protein [Novosphingobium sp.]